MKPRAISYSAAELAWIEANKTMFRTDSHKAFVEKFNRHDVTFGNYSGLCKRKGWLTGRLKGNGTKGRHRIYSKEEIDFIAATAELSRKDGHAAFVDHFGRASMSIETFVSLRKRLKIKTGRTGHFEKGGTPWSKGKKLPFNANSAATQFKPGLTPHNTKFAGHERVSEEGYIYISIDAPNPHTGFDRRYVHKHRWLWEQVNGPVPEGMVLKCLDGNKSNTDPSNWESIPLALLPRLNGIHGRGYDQAPPELKPVILAVSKLEHKARVARKAKDGLE